MNLVFVTVITSFFLLTIKAQEQQQQYSGNSVISCNNNDTKAPSPAFLYTCNSTNDPHLSCKAFLIFKSEKPYDSVSAISGLLSSDPQELARINNASISAVFPPNKEVIVPVTCSCFGHYYQANTNFTIPNSVHKTYSTIANNTFQGLTTCSYLMRENQFGEYDLVPGVKLKVSLRCACPSRNQTADGTKYMLTYLVSWGDSVPDISEKFNVSKDRVLDANSLKYDTTLFPFTTLLIPMPTKPSSSQTIIHYQQPSISLPPPTSSPAKGKAHGKFPMWIGIAAACVLLVLGVIWSTIFPLCKRLKTVKIPRIDSKTRANWVLSKDLRVEIASFEQQLKVYSFAELKKATGGFSAKSKIKGSMYCGKFGGEVLAIKKTSLDVSKEVNMLKSINHFNLINLQGVCENQGSFYLVFEYLHNGSLKKWLGRSSREETRRSCSERIQIALDVANGLHYLHSFTKPAYVHKDIKSSNILLDGNLRAKIANFSLARAAEREAYQTSHLLGTRGYMAPEYVELGQVSPMIDVYAFGVIMLELVTGKDVVLMQDGKEVLLAEAIVSILQKENQEAELESFLDPCFKGEEKTLFALRVTKLSVACLTKDPMSRPSMEELVSALSKINADVHKSEFL